MAEGQVVHHDGPLLATNSNQAQIKPIKSINLNQAVHSRLRSYMKSHDDDNVSYHNQCVSLIGALIGVWIYSQIYLSTRALLSIEVAEVHILKDLLSSIYFS